MKLIALDIDGTLVGHDLQLSPRLRTAIGAAQQRGARFLLATGRMYRSAVIFAEALQLPPVPLICYNGAMVREYPSGKLIFHDPLPVDVCREIARHCEAQGYHLNAYSEDELYVAVHDRLAEEYEHKALIKAHPVGPLSQWIAAPCTKMLIMDAHGRIAELRQEMQTLLGDRGTAVPSSGILLELIRPEVSKGRALAAVAEALGVKQADVVAMGDAGNDVPMLKWAGTSFTFSHGYDEAKRVATHVIDKGPGDCVVEALQMLGLFEG